jgi:hypothetical protein
MKIGNLKRQEGKWMFHLAVGRDFMYRDTWGWRLASVGILRIHTLPQEGVEIRPANYTGFLISWRYWLPFERGRAS